MWKNNRAYSASLQHKAQKSTRRQLDRTNSHENKKPPQAPTGKNNAPYSNRVDSHRQRGRARN